MVLVNAKEIIAHAKNNNYAIPQANFINQEMILAYIEASEEKNLPLILAFAEAHKEYISMEDAAHLGLYYAKKAKTPIILHLDHGQSFESIKKAIDLGFNSVMIDASSKSLLENIKITKEVVQYAHKKNIFVESEIGHVGSSDVVGHSCSNNDDENIYTSVEEAKKFAKETNTDSLAISIGTSHGTYKGKPKINIQRLKEIKHAISTPLVLHGGSSSGDENLNNCAKNGIIKINIYTDFLIASHNALRGENYYEDKNNIKKAIKEKLLHYYKVFETKGDF